MKKLILIATIALAPCFSAQDMVTKPYQSYQTEAYKAQKKIFCGESSRQNDFG